LHQNEEMSALDQLRKRANKRKVELKKQIKEEKKEEREPQKIKEEVLEQLEQFILNRVQQGHFLHFKRVTKVLEKRET
jgi:hypothetical protein